MAGGPNAVAAAQAYAAAAAAVAGMTKDDAMADPAVRPLLVAIRGMTLVLLAQIAMTLPESAFSGTGAVPATPPSVDGGQ